MNPEFESGVTASFLRSGRVLSNASNCAALIAAAGLLFAHERVVFAGSLLCWPVALYLGVRVAIDASLFEERAAGPDLDELLRAWGFGRDKQDRTLSERSRGALRLWKYLMAAVAVQLLVLAAALAMS